MVAPILFVGPIYLWLTPVIFDYATVNETVHDVMHFSMLIAGAQATRSSKKALILSVQEFSRGRWCRPLL